MQALGGEEVGRLEDDCDTISKHEYTPKKSQNDIGPIPYNYVMLWKVTAEITFRN